MSLFGSILSNTGTFDKLRQGYYDEKSNCGWVAECQEIKECIFDVCAPKQDLYGGAFYDSCIKACNGNKNMTLDDFMCDNPEVAYKSYGYVCPDFDPSTVKPGIVIFGRKITLMQLIILFLVAVVIYIIANRL